jgi:alkylhydroperoxidase/carboxymuconolactone decarboxylase family protein YurZ
VPVNREEISELKASLLFIGGSPSSVSMVRTTLTVE